MIWFSTRAASRRQVSYEQVFVSLPVPVKKQARQRMSVKVEMSQNQPINQPGELGKCGVGKCVMGFFNFCDPPIWCTKTQFRTSHLNRCLKPVHLVQEPPASGRDDQVKRPFHSTVCSPRPRARKEVGFCPTFDLLLAGRTRFSDIQSYRSAMHHSRPLYQTGFAETISPTPGSLAPKKADLVLSQDFTPHHKSTTTDHHMSNTNTTTPSIYPVGPTIFIY
ncbi:hypothetical protein B0T21DRAFT_43337 [Apiosordaria backusii]|uniref:Uncharacterized protein n=1 Tax=Apiosordaria backusii TaxID=314023 RepID=A0AA40AXI4_9PEZI|nr:hypothetical protein B0T21DRAFT_43337 [Apiosordaria backusii]